MDVNWFGHRMDNSAFQNGSALGRVREGERSVRKVHIHVGDDAVCGQWHLQTSAVGGEGVDAIGLIDIEEGQLNDSPALGVKQVDPQTPDYSMIKGWLHRCDELHHTTCRPLASENLERIKLVDVETRRIVKYPPDGCDYIALSYVWGCVEQPSYKLEDILPIVPATLEDAITMIRNPGKQYLWADSLCIDQQSEVIAEEKGK